MTRTPALALILSLALLCPPAPARAASPAVALDPFLARLADRCAAGDPGRAAELAEGRGMRVRWRDGVPWVPVVLEPAAGLAGRDVDPAGIAARGGEVDAVSRSFVRVLAPPAALAALATHPDVRAVRPPSSVLPQGFGALESEAVALVGADEYHLQGYDGGGVEVAVLDAGFYGLTSAIDDGELPADTVAVDGDAVVTWADLESVTPHGSAIAETLMDVAPGAHLTCIQVDDEVDVENAAAYAAANGIAVVNLSAAFVPTAYYDDTSVISQIVNASHDDDGVFWAVSAGNYAISHWRGTWGDDGDGLLNYNGFDHEMEIVTQHSTVAVFLNWDQYADPETDLDLYVYTAGGALKDSSTTLQEPAAGNPPSEFVSFPLDDGEDPYRFTVEHASGPTFGLDVTVIAFYDAIEHPVPQSSLMEPAEAHGAFSVGAVDQAVWNDPSPAIEVFSSQGPTLDGRLKPDLVAPDRTSTVTYGPGSGQGTSHSAPVAAGAAALLLGREPALGAEELAAALRAMAADAGDAGPDDVFGAGLLQLQLDPCVDGDGDGYGTGAFANAGCLQVAADCDDADPAVNPGAPEICNGIDDDCDPATDELVDGDGDGSTICDGDCDDGDADQGPDAVEDCDDGIDNDCDGLTDELDEDCAGDDDATGDDDDADDDAAGDDDDQDDGAAADDEGTEGCACGLHGTRAPGSAVLLLALAAGVVARRRT